MKNKILFIDRDGTLIEEPKDFQVDALGKILLKPFAIPTLLRLQSLGYRFVMVTNQDGLGTTSFPKDQFELCHNFILSLFSSQGVIFDEILICPHFKEEACDCRKPKTKILASYLERTDIDWARSYVIGDRSTDIQLAQNLKCEGILLGPEFSWLQAEAVIIARDRASTVHRRTNETDIRVSVNLNGSGHYQIQTGLNFFNHMLEQLSKHSGIDMAIDCKGDLEIDEHHTVEDVAITLGMALKESLDSKQGIQRYGFLLPMDDSLAQVALDLSGRAYFIFEGVFSRQMIGDLPTELVPHFFRSLSESLGANLNMKVSGDNTHHMVESCFKAVAKTFKQAVQRDLSSNSLPSTKGVL